MTRLSLNCFNTVLVERERETGSYLQRMTSHFFLCIIVYMYCLLFGMSWGHWGGVSVCVCEFVFLKPSVSLLFLTISMTHATCYCDPFTTV